MQSLMGITLRIVAASCALLALAALPLAGCLLMIAAHPAMTDGSFTSASPDQQAGSAALMAATCVASWLVLAVAATLPAAWREAHATAVGRAAVGHRPLASATGAAHGGGSSMAPLRRIVIAAVTLAALGTVTGLPASASTSKPTATLSSSEAGGPDTSWRPTRTQSLPVAAPSRSTAEVLVRRGDSLWTIAAAHLPPTAGSAEIDRAWRAWYSLNRTRIGDDPDLLRPGTPLLVPPSPAASQR